MHVDPQSVAGRTAGRFLKSLAISRGDMSAAVSYASGQNWLDSKSIVDVIQKGNVSGLDSSSFALTEPGKSFFETLTPTSILSKLTGARRVPLLTRCITFDSGSTGYSATEGKAVPISAAALSGDTVEPRHHVGIVVATNELLRTPGSETALARDLARAVTAAENASFLATVAGGILFGGSTQASAGATLTNIDTDVAFAVGALITAGSTLENAVWICSPVNAAALAAKRGTGGGPAFPDVRYDGGRLAGIPLITSTSAGNLLILLDLDNIVIAEGGGVQLSTSSVTSLEMLDDVPAVPPAIGAAIGDVLAPVVSTQVSLYQSNATALKCDLYRGWLSRSTAAAAYLSAASY